MDNKPQYIIEKLNFDGPLDLLLQLLEREKVDIRDIPIASITTQYLEYVSRLEEKDMEMVSEFLVMATTLLEIKARMLLPKEETEAEEEEDPREELVKRLLEYRRFKFIASALSDREAAAGSYYYREQDALPAEVRQFIPPVDLDELFADVDAGTLLRVFQSVMKRKEQKTDSRHSGFGVIKRERVPLRDCILRLISYAEKKNRFSFRELLDRGSSRTEVVVTFLAMLELMKSGQLEAQQTENNEIEVRVREGATLSADIDLSDIEDK